jgi:hypothetical protein
LSISSGFQWGSIILSVVGAFLAAYRRARIPEDLAQDITSWQGLNIIAQMVLEDKAESEGTLLAISGALLFQFLSILQYQSSSGAYVALLAIALGLTILFRTRARKKVYVARLLERIARATGGT